jgi:hypothetical protein
MKEHHVHCVHLNIIKSEKKKKVRFAYVLLVHFISRDVLYNLVQVE